MERRGACRRRAWRHDPRRAGRERRAEHVGLVHVSRGAEERHRHHTEARRHRRADLRINARARSRAGGIARGAGSLSPRVAGERTIVPRSFPGCARGVEARRAPRIIRRGRSARRRDGCRQDVPGTPASRVGAAREGVSSCPQLRRDSRDTPRERALWPRARSVHERCDHEAGGARSRRQWHGAPRRDRRAAAREPGEAAPRARREALRAPRLQPRDPTRRARHHGDEPRSCRDGYSRDVPGGPLLPHRGREASDPAVEGSRRRSAAACGADARRPRAVSGKARARILAGSDGGDAALSLARERARAQERDRAGSRRWRSTRRPSPTRRRFQCLPLRWHLLQGRAA